METTNLMWYLGGLLTPIALALTVKAIKRAPSDLKTLFKGFGNFIRL